MSPPMWADQRAEEVMDSGQDRTLLSLSVPGAEEPYPALSLLPLSFVGQGDMASPSWLHPLSLVVGRGPGSLLSRSETLGPCAMAVLCWSYSSLLVQRGGNPGELSVAFSMPAPCTTWTCPSRPTGA